MSQTYSTFVLTETVSAILQKLKDQAEATRSKFSGTSAPSSPVAGQWFLDTDTPSGTVWTLSFYDGTDWIETFRFDTTNNVVQIASGAKLTGTLDANSQLITNLASAVTTGGAVNKGQVDGIVQTVRTYIGTVNASDQWYVLAVPANCTIVAAKWTTETAIATDGTNYWQFQVRNLTAAVDLAATAKSTASAAITGDVVYDLGLDQNLTPSANDVLELQITKNASATTMEGCALDLQYKISV